MKNNGVRRFIMVFIAVQFIRGLTGFSNRWFSSDFTWFKFILESGMFVAAAGAVELVSRLVRRQTLADPAD